MIGHFKIKVGSGENVPGEVAHRVARNESRRVTVRVFGAETFPRLVVASCDIASIKFHYRFRNRKRHRRTAKRGLSNILHGTLS